MIDVLKPYPEYRDSGVPWLGHVPTGWTITRAKRLFTPRTELARPDDIQLSATQAFGVIPQADFERVVGRKVVRILQHLDKRRHVEVNDFVISMRSFQGGLERAWSRGCIRSSYVVLRPSARVTVDYYSYLFKSNGYIRALQATASFIRDGQDLNFDNFCSVDLPVPASDEQAAIGRFLNHSHRRISRYIRAKQKLIALLEEQRRATIHHAVTRGLDEGVRLKPSGIPWMPEVPTHWAVTRVKNEFSCLNGRRVPLSATERGSMAHRVYDYYGASGVIDKVEDYLFDDELLLLAEDGANLLLRNLPLAIIAKGKFWVNNHAHVLKPKSGNLDYLAGLLECIDYTPWISGAAQPKLTEERLMRISLGVPPRAEQDRISDWMRAHTSRLVLAIESARKQVLLAREYRSRLTEDVVTGKLDIREASAQLPEEVNERQPFDAAEGETATEIPVEEVDATAEEVEA